MYFTYTNLELSHTIFKAKCILIDAVCHLLSNVSNSGVSKKATQLSKGDFVLSPAWLTQHPEGQQERNLAQTGLFLHSSLKKGGKKEWGEQAIFYFIIFNPSLKVQLAFMI